MRDEQVATRARRLGWRHAGLASALVIVAGIAALALTGLGLHRIGHALITATPGWIALALVADGAARCCCARSPGSRRCAPPCPRRAIALAAGRARDDDRRDGLGGVPRAHRRAHARGRARAPAGGAQQAPAADRRRHGVLADADQPARAGDPRGRSPSPACRCCTGTRGRRGRARGPARGLRAGARRPAPADARASARARRASRARRGTLARLLGLARRGLVVFARPRYGVAAVAAQLLAWALQWLACYMVMLALGSAVPGGPRGGRRDPARGERQRGPARDALQRGRLPGRLPGRARRLRRRRRPGARLRHHPAGRRGRDGARARRPGAARRGPDLAGHPPARRSAGAQTLSRASARSDWRSERVVCSTAVGS